MKLHFKSFLILLTLFSTINAKSLMGDEEEDDNNDLISEDRFSQLIMTSTVAYTAPTTTRTENFSTITSTNILPTGIISTDNDLISMTETEIICVKSLNLASYPYKINTKLPADVDDAVVLCGGGEFQLRKAICDYNMNCYKYYDDFTTYKYYPSTCTLYTSKTNDPIPEISEYITPTAFCKPVKSVTTISVSSTQVPRSYSTVTIDGIEVEMYSTGYIFELESKTLDEYKCNIVYPPSTTTTTTTTILTPYWSIKTQPCCGSVYKDIFYTSNNLIKHETIKVPDTMKSIHIDASCYTIAGHGKSTQNTKVVGENKKTTTPPITLPTSTIKPYSTYCDKQQNCFGFYTTTHFSSIPVYPTTICSLYTPIPVPTTSVPILDICHFEYEYVSTSVYQTSATNLYGIKTINTYFNDNYETVLYSYYYTLTTSTAYRPYCKTLKPISIINVTTTISTTDDVSFTVTSTTDVPSSIVTESKPTTVTTTSKCLPVIVTVTEKENVVVTEKETVTITVPTKVEEKDDSHCSNKWEQCGGSNYNGPTCCQGGFTCHKINEYYSQCI